jgi:hypothetical protein
MRDANPARNPQGGHKDAFFANPQSSAPQSGKSHRQATMIQEALDMACEQLLDEISIKVMLEKDPVGWKAYNPLTDEEQRLYNALVTPPVNPHPFISGVFEQAGVTHLSSAGGTPTLLYLASMALPTEGENGGMPIPILPGGTGSPLGVAPPFANDGGSEDADSTTSDGPTLPTAGGMLPTPLPLRSRWWLQPLWTGCLRRLGGTPPSPLLLRRWPQSRQRTPLRS